MRIVFDTNIWISALLFPDSVAGLMIARWQKQSQFDLVISEHILQEIKRVLGYPKIAKRLKWEPEQIEQYITDLSFLAEIVDTEDCNVVVPDDPNDSPILATLIKGEADYLITGDADLLNLQTQYPILTLAEFSYKLNQESP